MHEKVLHLQVRLFRPSFWAESWFHMQSSQANRCTAAPRLQHSVLACDEVCCACMFRLKQAALQDFGPKSAHLSINLCVLVPKLAPAHERNNPKKNRKPCPEQIHGLHTFACRQVGEKHTDGPMVAASAATQQGFEDGRYGS